MIILISPAKSLNLDTDTVEGSTSPLFKKETAQLVAVMKTYDAQALSKLMGISAKLGDLNEARFQNFKSRNTKQNSKPAALIFDGDVYRGLKAPEWKQSDLDYAQKHLRILSGLYGILRPLDTIQPYRLEMGSSIKTSKGSGLYKFWGDTLSKHVNNAMRGQNPKVLINLASNEYFKAINIKALKIDSIIHINFREYRDGKAKFISFSAKVARGLVADYIIRNRIENTEDIKVFSIEGYHFDNELSDGDNWIFSR